MTLKEIKYTVDIAGITPTVEQLCGTQGDHRVTKLEFTMTDELYGAVTTAADTTAGGKALYRFDIYNGDGSIWSSDATEISGNTGFSIELEEKHTHFGGKITVYLVISVLSPSNETEVELFSFPAALRLKNKPDGVTQVGDNYESLTSLAERARASKTAAAASEAAANASAETAQSSALSASMASEKAEKALENIKTTVNAALDEAKASGEFDGKDGTSISHAWDGTVLWVISAQGVSYADLKGEKGDKGDTGPQGEKGESGADGKDAVIDQNYNAESKNAQSGKAVAEAVSDIKNKIKKLSVGSPPFSQAVIIKPKCTGDGDTDYDAKYIDDNNWSNSSGFAAAKGYIATRNDSGNLTTDTPTDDTECANKKYVDNMVGDIETVLNSISVTLGRI